MSLSALIWTIPLGLLVGLALGALGGGGSILTVPALVYLLGQDPKAATTGSLLIVGLSALIGTLPHHRAGNVRWSKGLVFGLVGIGGSVLGSKLAAGIAPALLLGLFSVLMLVVAVLMWRRQRTTRAAEAERPEVSKVLPVILAATGVGLLTGFFGVGGGFAVVPALVLALGLSMPRAVGTSLLVISLNSASALVARLGAGIQLDWPVIGAFSVFAVVGSLLGQRLTTKVSPRNLAYAFIVLLVAVAVYTAAQSIPQLL